MDTLMGLATEVQLQELSRISYAPLAEAFRAMAPRQARHTGLGLEGLAQVVKSLVDRSDASAAVKYWRPRVAATFGGADAKRFEMQRRFGLRQTPNDVMLEEWTNITNRHPATLGRI